MSAPINDGGPAFSSPGILAHDPEGNPQNPWGGYGWAQDPQPGMSLRDWLAGQALAGWLASYGPEALHPCEVGGEKPVAEFSYQIADAMIATRAKAEGRAV